MEAKKALEQIRSLLFADQVVETPQEEVVIEFAEGVLADGTIVKFDKLEVGGMISVVTPNGEVPAPVGEHELEDGTIIVVSQEGVIAEVKMPAAEQPEAEIEVEMSEEEDAPATEEAPAEPQPDRFAEMQEAFEAKFAEVESKVELLNNVTKQLVEFMEAFAKVETAEETQKPKNTFMSQNKVSRQDAYKKLQNVFQNLKK